MARTDPRDVARVESKTYICTEDKRETIPQAKQGVKGQLGNWMSVAAMNKELDKRFPGCMKGMIVQRDENFGKNRIVKIKGFITRPRFILSTISSITR